MMGHLFEKGLGYLPENKVTFVGDMIDALVKIKGIEAIALGGSYARGKASKSSDIDLGIYYSEKSPPNLDELRKLAQQFDSTGNLICTNFYEWGPWVNGGAWLNTQAGEIDWLFRNLDQLTRVINETRQGRFSWDFRQQPPYGFFSVMYLADLQNNVPLYDPKEIFAQLKEDIKEYPELLRQSIIQEHLWSIEFAHFNAKKFASKGSVYGVAGCITRIAAEQTQVLFALNRVYFSTEKDALEMIETFPIKPQEYASRINRILSCLGTEAALIESLKQLNALTQEIIRLSPNYSPKYLMDN